jgi:hypothetical protein
MLRAATRIWREISVEGMKTHCLTRERNDGQAKEKVDKEKETEECSKGPQMWLVWENEQLDKDRML